VNLGEVRATLSQMLAEGRGEAAIDLVVELIGKLRDDNQDLVVQVARLLRRHIGRTTERVSAAQLRLLFAEIDPAPAELVTQELPPLPASGELSPPAQHKAHQGHGRRPLPEHLPREVVEHRVPEAERACPTCGKERTRIGHETSEELEFVPASFVVKVHRREKLVCRPCEEHVAVAAAAPKVIEKGLPGPGLLTQVLVSKYADHVPLNRQRKIFLREAVDLAVSTLADWVKAADVALRPLADRIREHALHAHLLQADDTGIKVLDEDAPGGSKRGHLWMYAGDATWAAVVYTPDWRKEGPLSFLAERRGWVQADAYAGYDGLYSRRGATAVEVGCWAHARRPFFELWQGGDLRAHRVLSLIGDLYAIEEKATADGADPEERLWRRGQHARPVLQRLAHWMADTYEAEPPKSAMAKAIGYCVNQWEALNRFLEDGRLPLDNNLCERALRPICVGRKNYLFCGSDAGAERAATMYTVLGTCALVGAEPRAYLIDVFRKLEMERWPNSCIDELLPPNWIKSAPQAARVRPAR
jgi:transposase